MIKEPIPFSVRFAGTLIHKINPDTQNIVKVYYSFSEINKEIGFNVNRSIKEAFENNTIFNKFKWIIIESK